MNSSVKDSKMLFLVHAVDRGENGEDRLRWYKAHREHMARIEAYNIQIVMAGPLVEEQHGETMIGSFLLIEAENKSYVEAFIHDDPFYVNEVWEQISIHRFLQRIG
ncbi:YciI family protein [Brevibacillus sp. Leaf182]|uniref:YciI family protein n=1 Tax=Brevibacillus sp. Leaf182 TaxID=1736290 RepID=UPI0006F7AD86|nr:YciI family protein [Brevibacillus sp. Leaf182]RAT96658.1 hypothetical protein ASG16_017900 [Brevibacillus sp. Leaf182]